MHARASRTDRDWDRADAWLSLASIGLIIALSLTRSVLGPPQPLLEALGLLAFLAHPYFLIRVIRHFRPVPGWWMRGLLLAAALGALLGIVLPSPKPTVFRITALVFVGSVQVFAAATLALTARRYRGLVAWRLNFAAVGATLVAVVFAFVVMSANGDTYLTFTGLLRPFRLTAFAMIGVSVLGLLPPRRLRRLLQQGVEYGFLRRTNEHGLDDRSRLVPIDLAYAASRGTATVATVVLTGDGPLHVSGATDPSWRGLVIDPLDGAIGAAVASKEVQVGDTPHLEAELQRLAGDAERFLALPIVGASRVWGVLLLIQRRRSLFPFDDLDLLRRLCRYTAEIYDQAQLVADEHARRQRDADAHLDLILESLQDYAVITTDETGAITTWNSGAAQMFQYTAAEAMGMSVTRLFDDDAPWMADQLQQARLGQPTIADSTGRRRDGSRPLTSLVIRPLVGRGLRRGGFVLVMRDVTQRRVLEDRLRQAQKLEAIGRLAAGIAHDFNNMLTVIMGYAENIADTTPAEHRGGIDEIRKAAERSATLTRQLLTFSRQQVSSPQHLRITDVVAGLVPMLKRLLGERIEIVDVGHPEAPVVFADRTHLEQVVVNLAVNARDAMPSGGRLTIRVRPIVLSGEDAASLTGRAGLHTVLEVSDTGSGVDLATQSRMFEPFFTTKGVGRGTGLGLAIVYGIVQQMNGAIAVESELGHGTTFRIYIPAV